MSRRPHKKLSKDYVRNKARQELRERLDELSNAIEEIKKQGAARPSPMERAEFIAERIKGPLRKMAQEEVSILKKQLWVSPSSYIQDPDRRRRTWHRPSVNGYLHLPTTWRTVCGWPHFVRADQLPEGARRCDWCRFQ